MNSSQAGTGTSALPSILPELLATRFDVPSYEISEDGRMAPVGEPVTFTLLGSLSRLVAV